MNDGLAFPFAITLVFAMMGVDTAVSVLPRAATDDFFTVQSVTVERAGAGAVLNVDRTIKRPIHMEFAVRIMGRGKSGWVETCTTQSGPILYLPDAELPDLITLDWWTWGKCPNLPEGPARVITTWIPEPQGLGPVSIVSEVEWKE